MTDFMVPDKSLAPISLCSTQSPSKAFRKIVEQAEPLTVADEDSVDCVIRSTR